MINPEFNLSGINRILQPPPAVRAGRENDYKPNTKLAEPISTCARMSQAWIQRVAQTISEKIKGQNHQHESNAWEKRQMRGIEEVFVYALSS